MDPASAGVAFVGFSASLATLAAVVANNSQKIHDLWIIYKDAPRELNRLKRTVETLEVLVTEIARRSTDVPISRLPNHLAQLWTKRASDMRHDLEGLQKEVESITRLIDASPPSNGSNAVRSDAGPMAKLRLRARVRMYFGESTMAKYESLLSTHIDTFTLVQSMVLEAQGEAQIAMQARHVDALTTKTHEMGATLLQEFHRLHEQLQFEGSNVTRSRAHPIRMHAFTRNPDFVGREHLLTELDETLEPSQVYQRRFALWGLGGIGKTQIATEYCYRQADRSVFWVFGNSDEKFAEGYRNLALQANLPRYSAQDDQDTMCFRVKSWLESEDSGNWVLVIDNLDLPQLALRKYIPTQRGAVLFTTRDRRVLHDLTGRKGAEVDKMSHSDAIETFWQLSHGSRDDGLEPELSQLLDRLDHIPLAIAQAAAFIWHTGMSIADYLAFFGQDEEIQLDALGHVVSADVGSQQASPAIMRTWEITAARLSVEDARSLKLLQLLSFFDPRGIPKVLIRNSGVVDFARELDVIRAAALLRSFALVTEDATGQYRLHSLVSFWTRRRMGDVVRQERLASAISLVLDIFPPGQYDNVPLAFQLAPHVSQVSRHSLRYHFRSMPLGDVEYLISGVFLDRGELEASMVHAKRCLDVYQKEGCPGPTVAKVQNVIGQIFWRQGALDETLQWFTTAMKSVESTPKPERDLAARLQLLKIYSNLGDAYLALSKLPASTSKHGQSLAGLPAAAQAEEWYFRALNGKRDLLHEVEETSTPSQVHAARESLYITVDLLGKFYTGRGQLEKAKAFHGEALADRLVLHGPTHWRTLDSRLGVARVHKLMAKFEDALSLALQTLSGLVSYGDSLSSRDQLLNWTCLEIAEILDQAGRGGDSVPWYRRALVLGSSETKRPWSLQRIVEAQNELLVQGVDHGNDENEHIDGSLAHGVGEKGSEVGRLGTWVDERFGILMDGTI